MRVNQSGLAAGIPLHLRFRAGLHPIVGTTTEYSEFRGLMPSDGRWMAMLGECVVGAVAARKLGVQVGGYVLSTPAGACDVLGGVGVAIATAVITALVFVLSIRLRQREIETIRKIGGPRRRLWAILSAEILIVVFGAVIVAAGMTKAVSTYGGLLVRVVSG